MTIRISLRAFKNAKIPLTARPLVLETGRSRVLLAKIRPEDWAPTGLRARLRALRLAFKGGVVTNKFKPLALCVKSFFAFQRSLPEAPCSLAACCLALLFSPLR